MFDQWTCFGQTPCVAGDWLGIVIIQVLKIIGACYRSVVARAVPEILYFRCPVCSKRFPGATFGEDELQVECEACGTVVDSPHVIPTPNDRSVESPFTLAEIAQEMNPPAEIVAQTQDIAEQLRQAFGALSQIDKAKFLEETLPTVELSEIEKNASGSTTVRLITIGVLFVLGVALLALLYFEG